MQKHFHKYISVVLAIIVVFSTISVTLTMHFCGKIVSSVTVLQNVKECCNIGEKSEKITQVSKKSCCSTVKITKQSQTEFSTQKDVLTVLQKTIFTSFISVYLSLFSEQDKKDYLYLVYLPPLISKPIYKLDQVYLI